MRRKGELSPAGIDRGWPHQVALPARASLNGAYLTIHEFCKYLSNCSRGHSVVGPDNQWWQVYCFAKPEDAEKFLQRFGGEKFDPALRGKGRNWAHWNRP
jgi:hypothetical protein